AGVAMQVQGAVDDKGGVGAEAVDGAGLDGAAGIDGGGAVIAVVAVQDHRAGAHLGQAAIAADIVQHGIVHGQIEGQGAIVGDGARAQAAAYAGIADLQGGADIDGGGAGIAVAAGQD